MKFLSALMFLFLSAEGFAQFAWYDQLDSTMRQKKNFAHEHHLKEIKKYHFAKEHTTDSLISFQEQYDPEGNVIMTREYQPDGIVFLETVYTYDAGMKVVKIIKKYSDAIDRMDYTAVQYNQDKRVSQVDKDDFARSKSLNVMSTKYDYYPNGKLKSFLREGYSINFCNYDKEGHLINVSGQNGDTAHAYRYDKYGFLRWTNLSGTNEIRYVNDSLGNNLQIDTYIIIDRQKNHYSHFEANYDGKKIKESHQERCPSTNLENCTGKLSFLNHIVYEYDSSGLENKWTGLTSKGKFLECVKSYYSYYP